MPGPTSPRLTTALLVPAAVLAGCAASPPTAQHSHQHTVTVTVTETGIAPAPDVTIPVFSTVVWRNLAAVPVRVELAAAPCHACATVLNFDVVTEGSRSQPIPPQGIAALCFHEPGDFGYVVHVGNAERRGQVHVEAAP
jgi:hypothetical protein